MSRARPGGVRLLAAAALVIAIGLGVAASPFASGAPDGLERVAGDKAFLDRGRTGAVQEGAPVPDYAFPGVEDPRLATALAGLVGVLGVFGLGLGVALVVRRRGGRGDRAPRPAGTAA